MFKIDYLIIQGIILNLDLKYFVCHYYFIKFLYYYKQYFYFKKILKVHF